MTKTARCEWCGRRLPTTNGAGRPRRYCKQSCRQRSFEARRRSAELGLNEHELVITRTELDALRDDLYVVEAAVEDVERDIEAAGDDATELRHALEWLLDALRPVFSSRT